MAQQPQATSQVVFGPASNGGGDILHYIPANSNSAASNSFVGWVDKNGAVQGVSFVVNGLQTAPAASITNNTAGGVFSYTTGGQVVANLPGGSAMEQVPFIVKAAGTISLAAGTYTATVQPLLYASTTPGFTAAAANAIYSLAAVSLTMTNAAATVQNYEVELHLSGNTAGGTLSGWYQNYGLTTSTGTTFSNAVAGPTIAAATSNISSVSLTAAIPVQFAFGITLAGTASTACTLSLGSFFIES